MTKNNEEKENNNAYLIDKIKKRRKQKARKLKKIPFSEKIHTGII